MTVQATTPVVTYLYTGPGAYSYSFKAFLNSDIIVEHISSAGVTTVLAEGGATGYTLLRDVDDVGGTVTTLYSPVGGTLRISRVIPFVQSVALENQGPLDMTTLEKALDRNVMLMQQLSVDVLGIDDISDEVYAAVEETRATLDAIEALAVTAGEPIATLSDLMLLDDHPTLIHLLGRTSNADGGEGVFVWNSGDYTAQVAQDTYRAVYVPLLSDVTGASGVWIRQHDGTVNIKCFGVKTDGTRCTSEVSAALNSGYVIETNEGETYSTAPISVASDLSIIGKGAFYTDITPESSFLYAANPTVVTTTVDEEVGAGLKSIKLASVTGVTVGSTLEIQSITTLWRSDNRGILYEGVIAKVVEIDDPYVKVEANLPVGFGVGDTVIVRAPAKIFIDGPKFQREKYDGSSYGVTITGYSDVVVKDVEIVDCTRIGLLLSSCYKPLAEDIRVTGANLCVSESLGYGIAASGCYGARIIRPVTYNCRRGVDIQGYTFPSWFCLVKDVDITCGGYGEDGTTLMWPEGTAQSDGIGSHGGAYGTLFDGGQIKNPQNGVFLRGRQETATNIIISGSADNPVACLHGSGAIFDNVRYTSNFELGVGEVGTVTAGSRAVQPEYFAFVNGANWDSEGGLIFRNCYVSNVKVGFIYFDIASGGTFNKLELSGNTVVVTSTAAAYLLNSPSTMKLSNFLNDGMNRVISEAASRILYPKVTVITTDNINILAPNQYTVTIEDDSFIIIPALRSANRVNVRLFTTATSNASLDSVIKSATVGAVVNFCTNVGVTVLGAALTGTTGTDGNLSISFVGGMIYLENRTGTATEYVVTVV